MVTRHRPYRHLPLHPQAPPCPLSVPGDTSKAPVNLISGNSGNGVWLQMGTSRNRVLDNYIGLDRRGRSLRNSGKAVVDRGHRDLVKGNVTHPRG